jgi:type II secretory pathway pseudopilin PulG
MKKIAAALVALVTAAGLLATAVSSSTATSSAAASAERATHTKRFVLHQVASANLGSNSFAGTDRVKSRAINKPVGFVSYTGTFNRDTDTVRLWAGIALKGGIINARVTLTEAPPFTGRITGGSGAYEGITGTVTGRSMGPKTYLTLHYEL